MTTASQLWPPGSKYDFHEIRERLKKHRCQGLRGKTLGQTPISAMFAEHFAAGLPSSWSVLHRTQPILEEWWNEPDNQGPPVWFDDLYDSYEWPDVGEWGTESALIWRPGIDDARLKQMGINADSRIEVVFNDLSATCTCTAYYLPYFCQKLAEPEIPYCNPEFLDLVHDWLTGEAFLAIDQMLPRILGTATATELWPPGSKYDIHAIRQRLLKRCPNSRWPDAPLHQQAKTSLYHGDCRQILLWLPDRTSFLFADPPFNIGHGYKGFDDNLPKDEYRQFTQEWIGAAKGCLTDDGVMAIHVPDDVVPLVLEAVSLPRIAWMIWHFRFGQCHRSNWINSKAHCLVFAKNPDQYTWNPDEVLVASDRATTYKDKRTQQSATPGQRVPFDVWGIPSDGPFWGRVQGNSKERRPGHPNQLPEVYLERLIRAYTNPGDLVLDPFLGSGTTVVVAEALGRKSVGIDVSLANISSAFERVRKGAVRVSSG